jgi:hypothetical protein
MKKCSGCKEIKEDSEFYNSRLKRNGSRCKKCTIEDHIKFRNKRPQNVWAKDAINRHKRNGYNVYITPKELEKIAIETQNCPMCGKELDYLYGNKDNIRQFNSPSLDRINNENYIDKNNCWIICCSCNVHKSDKTLKEFVLYCEKIYKKFENKV